MKKSLVRILLFLSVIVLAVSCVNYNRIRFVKGGKPSKREFVDQTHTENKPTVASIDNGFYEIDEAEVDTIAISDLNCDTIFLKTGKIILAQNVELKRNKLSYRLCCEGCTEAREFRSDEIDTIHFAMKPLVVESVEVELEEIEDIVFFTGEAKNVKGSDFTDTIYFNSGKVRAVKLIKASKNGVKYYYSTPNGRITVGVANKSVLKKVTIGDKANSEASELVYKKPRKPQREFKTPRNYENEEGRKKKYRKSGRILLTGVLSIFIPLVGLLFPVFFLWAAIVATKSIKKTVPTTEAGDKAKQFFKKAVSLGKGFAYGLLGVLLALIIFIGLGFVFSTGIFTLIVIAGGIAFISAMAALIQLIKSAKQSRIDKLNRKPGDTTGDELRRTTWFLITLLSFLTVVFLPIVLLIAIGNTMSVKEEDY